MGIGALGWVSMEDEIRWIQVITLVKNLRPKFRASDLCGNQSNKYSITMYYYSNKVINLFYVIPEVLLSSPQSTIIVKVC